MGSFSMAKITVAIGRDKVESKEKTTNDKILREIILSEVTSSSSLAGRYPEFGNMKRDGITPERCKWQSQSQLIIWIYRFGNSAQSVMKRSLISSLITRCSTERINQHQQESQNQQLF